MTTERLIVQVDDSDVEKLNETLGDTEKQLKDVDKAADKAGDAIDAAAGASMDLGAAAGAMGAAVGIAAAAMAVAANAVALYTEKTAEQETAMNTFLNSLDTFNLNLGQSIVESEGVTRALAIFDNALNNSEGAVDGIAGAVSGLVDFALSALEFSIQTAILSWGAAKLLWIGVVGTLDMLWLNIRQGANTIQLMTLAVVDLSLAFAEGLVSVISLAVTKIGDLVKVLEPFAAQIGLDFSGITAVIDGVNGALTTQIENLRGMRTAAQEMGLDIMAEQEERLAAAQERRNERSERSMQIMEETGDTMMMVEGAFNATGDSIERTRRATEGAAGATTELAEANDVSVRSLFNLGLQLAENVALHVQTEYASRTAAQLALEEAKANQELTQRLLEQKLAREEALALQQQMMEAEAALSGQLEAVAAGMNPVRDQMLGSLKEGANQLAEIGVTALATAVTSGKNVGKEFKKMMGEMLMAQGKASILQGALMLIPFGPQFNPIAGPSYIAQGAAMMGLGMAFGATASGGGGGGGAAPTVAAPTAGSMSQTYVTNNFQGMFNDPRESARIIGDATEQAALRGTV